MNYNLLKWIGLMLLFYACEKAEDIEDFPLHKSKLVVNSLFNPDSTWKIHVSKSLSVLDNADLKPINNATIQLFENGQLIALTPPIEEDGWYTSNQKPTPNQTYSIEVAADKFTSVNSYANTPSPVLISSAVFSKLDSATFQNEEEVDVSITFQDPIGEINYYEIAILIEYATPYYEYIYGFDSLGNYEIVDSFLSSLDNLDFYSSITSNDIVIENDNNQFATSLFFSDQFFDGQRYEFNLQFYYLSSNYKYYVELKTHSKDSYDYNKTYQIYQNTRNDPFAQKVQVFTNIKNGYGIFAGYSKQKMAITYK